MKKKYSLLRQAYHKDGALVLHGLLGDDFVSILTKHFQFLVSSPSDKYQSGFYRVGYDLFEDLDALKDVLMSPDFVQELSVLTPPHAHTHKPRPQH